MTTWAVVDTLGSTAQPPGLAVAWVIRLAE